jgi:Fur family transcriptional regulator, peroxide stress response regulator
MSITASANPEAGEALLRATLEAHGQRCTEQRSAVYRFLAGTDRHPSADEVFTVVRGEIPDISLATVYKALETLVSCGLAVKLTYGDDAARYDARTDDHYHSRCLRCGVVRDVAGAAPAIPQIEVGSGFRVEGLRVEVVGYCSPCAGQLE